MLGSKLVACSQKYIVYSYKVFFTRSLTTLMAHLCVLIPSSHPLARIFKKGWHHFFKALTVNLIQKEHHTILNILHVARSIHPY